MRKFQLVFSTVKVHNEGLRSASFRVSSDAYSY